MENDKQIGWFSKVAVFSGFFIMGFVDIVGIATNYVKSDFGLSATLSNTIPMMVFIWFALFSIPAGILMGRIGKQKSVLLALIITAVALLIPFVAYRFVWVLVGFSLLGISNTLLQVSLNPLVASLFNREKTASILTAGQFVKSISSLLGPIIAGGMVTAWGDWKLAFPLLAIVTLLPILFLALSGSTDTVGDTNLGTSRTSFSSVLGLLKERPLFLAFLSIILIVGLDVGINTTAPELMMKRAGLELNRAGLASSLYFLAKIAGTLVGSFLLLKVSPIRFLKVSLLLAIAAFVPLTVATEGWILLSAIFIIGLACANLFSIIFSFALNEKPDRSNEVSALMIMGVSGGAVILPLLGMVNDLWGIAASLAILAISLVIILIFIPKKDNHATR